MSQPYSTTNQVLDRVLASLVSQAAWNLSDPGAAAIADITYTAVGVGPNGPVTVGYAPGGTAGAETVAVNGSAVIVRIASGVSTATQVLAAINASTAALAVVSAAITGTATNPQTATSAPVVITGSVAQRIQEGDRRIDAKLAALEVALPFATNPPALTDLSVKYARYACFRDLYAAGDPDKPNPTADHYLQEFEKDWLDFEEGWQKLVDATGAQVAMTKFATLTSPYPVSTGCDRDEYPNYPNGPYSDPPGIGG